MANTHEVLEGVKDYTLELLGTKARDEAVDAAGRAESAATRSEGAAESATGDAAATAADRVATGEDRAQTGRDAEATEQWAGQSKDAATLAITAAATVTQYVGDGFPEGKVAAPVGSIYTDRQATAGAVGWIKTSGTGTTGWKVQHGDTGWRSLNPATGNTVRTGTGTIRVKREGSRVIWRMNEVGLTDGTGTEILIHANEITLGFKPYADGPVFHLSHESGASFTSTLKVASSIYWVGANSGLALTVTRNGFQLQGEFSYTTDDPWPSVLPGTPA